MTNPFHTNIIIFLNYYNDDGKNIQGAPIDNALQDNEGVEYSLIPNDE